MGYLGQEEALETQYVPLPAQAPTLWESIWGPVSQVLKTGAETFAKVAPYVIKRPTTPYMPAYGALPTYPGQVYRGGAIPPGYEVVIGSMGPTLQPLQVATPGWILPAVALAGGFLLVSMMQKKR